MIDIRKLKELVKLMVDNDLSELDLRDEQETVSLKRPTATPMSAVTSPTVATLPAAVAAPQPAHATPTLPAEASTDEDAGLDAITSPMVGTFYSAPDPESPAFVAAGSAVTADSVVCIVEAMKVFSEIKAELAGTIEKVLVKNGDPVEFGQKLFLVRPS